MSAERIARALDGGKVGAGWTACCPTHDDQRPSLSIRDAEDGMVLVRCHAGCGQERLIAALLRARNLWTDIRLKSLRAARPIVERQQEDNDVRRSKDGIAIWQSATPAGGALVPANGEPKVVVSKNDEARQP
jgi:putative DNA primase/helicase